MKAIFDDLNLTPDFDISGQGGLASRFDVTGLAVASMAAVGLGIADLRGALGFGASRVSVDRRLASLWFGWSLQPQGWEIPPAWDALAGDYEAADGWIKLHTNAPHHRAAVIRVLGGAKTREAVAQEVRKWQANVLETAVVDAGGVAAEMRSATDWADHPQGRAVAAEPLIAWAARRPAKLRSWQPTASRPLHGLRVLDLTRILAGPVATRTLAGYGAEVLRIDPVDWEEPAVAPEVTLGKRCCRLDLRTLKGKAEFARLLQGADVLVHGYRPDALQALGLGADWRRRTAPDVIEVSLCAYGWTGPWAKRRGYDSLVQMSSGIADAGRKWAGATRPTPLPVQALDHATGYLMAAATLAALRDAVAGRGLRNCRLSLARTAALLMDTLPTHTQNMPDPGRADYAASPEVTPWGPALRLRPAIDVADVPMMWDRPATRLGHDAPEWL